MDDRELLELAAKAAGLHVVDRGSPVTLYVESDGCKSGVRWNPLADDSDALRLAVALRLDVGSGFNLHYEEVCMVSHAELFSGWFEEPYGSDPSAATRRAIVRGAAEIGKGCDLGPRCKTNPTAPHGFLRNASHTAGRYVCECEFWEPEPVAYFYCRSGRIVSTEAREALMARLGNIEKVPLWDHPRKSVAFPAGYEIHELPADYTGKVWIEGQVRRLHDIAQGTDHE